MFIMLWHAIKVYYVLLSLTLCVFIAMLKVHGMAERQRDIVWESERSLIEKSRVKNLPWSCVTISQMGIMLFKFSKNSFIVVSHSHALACLQCLLGHVNILKNKVEEDVNPLTESNKAIKCFTISFCWKLSS